MKARRVLALFSLAAIAWTVGYLQGYQAAEYELEDRPGEPG